MKALYFDGEKPIYMENYKNSYHGKTIGRFSGRINLGKYTLNGKEVQLEVNDNDHNNHLKTF